MNITGDFDPDAYGKPKFNSTILVPNERLQVQEGIENTGQNGNYFKSFFSPTYS